MNRRYPSRRWYGFFVAGLLVVGLVFAWPGSRTLVLRSAGWLLVSHQPQIRFADVIVVAIDAKGAGTLEAADLVHAGVAGRVAVFEDPPTASDREFIRRGLPWDDRAAVSMGELRTLGVQNVERIPRDASGSTEEGEILPRWCKEHGYRSVVLVTSADHSRRLARIMRRATHGQAISVEVVRSPYSNFDPDHWWKTRNGARTEIVEGEKLLLDIVRHPFS